jgi:hypothetical protein
MTYQPKVEACRSCKAPVVWAHMPSGKWAPFDAKPERRFILHPGEDNILRAEAQPTYQSHYVTCPDAKAWRSGAAGTPPTDQKPPVHYPGHNPAIPSVPPEGRERADLD